MWLPWNSVTQEALYSSLSFPPLSICFQNNMMTNKWFFFFIIILMESWVFKHFLCVSVDCSNYSLQYSTCSSLAENPLSGSFSRDSSCLESHSAVWYKMFRHLEHFLPEIWNKLFIQGILVPFRRHSLLGDICRPNIYTTRYHNKVLLATGLIIVLDVLWSRYKNISWVHTEISNSNLGDSCNYLILYSYLFPLTLKKKRFFMTS